jgi:hypothetical protein
MVPGKEVVVLVLSEPPVEHGRPVNGLVWCVGAGRSEFGNEGDTESCGWVGKVSGALGFSTGAVG